jgi:hypothetical protein
MAFFFRGGKETTMATSISSSAERVCSQSSPAASSVLPAGAHRSGNVV